MKRMFRLLTADEIDCRVATVNDRGCTLLLYKDARVDQNILDETVGPGRWQRSHQVIDGNLYCSVGIKFDEWIWKQDVGVESYTEKEKGQASDAFKRACFNWGIGRELYTAPFIWIPAGKVNLEDRGGKKTTNDRFTVKTIGYDKDGNINQLTIINPKTGKVVFTMGVAEDQKQMEMIDSKINDTDLKAVRGLLQRLGKTEEGICEYFKIEKLEDMTVQMMTDLNNLIIEAGKKKKGVK
jgi:hypothetical protein